MKKLSVSALAIAGMMVSSAQAVEFQVDDSTTLSVFGAVELAYNDISTIDNAGGDEGSDLVDKGSVLGVGAQHRFENGLTAYVSTEFEFDVLGTDGDFDRDESYVGLRGDFGDVRFGQYDNLFIDTIYDVIDPFEEASLGEEAGSGDDRTVAYFSPDFNGFSFQLQSRVEGDRVSNSGDSELALIGVVNYAAERWSVHAGFDDRGSEVDTNGDTLHDPSYGVGGTLGVTERLGLSARFAVDGQNETDTEYYGVGVAFDYGAGDLYGAVQEVDPDQGDARTQFAAGANYFIADNLYVYGEYGAFDAPSTATGAKDSLYELGAIYEF